MLLIVPTIDSAVHPHSTTSQYGLVHRTLAAQYVAGLPAGTCQHGHSQSGCYLSSLLIIVSPSVALSSHYGYGFSEARVVGNG
ncbi:hypothetical protein J3L11_06330 [Shewanella sp. 4t3-1-2LB]|uniref:hypothetical protein n=1 Tax=Shewanella sp. 4t3-1-2LB TaxID=2817682 RepID=UPI001A99DD8E|nr:hypothetical protein [Shewanella sp. 4t3-1-2LB]MBO1271268.1 hypothetical protein [Shewanella sp. 4t3-1-2LB]